MSKYARSFIILEGVVPEEWTSTDGKQVIIAEMEKLFAVNGSAVGPANFILHAIYIRTENGDILLPNIERMRKEYPLLPEEPQPRGEARIRVSANTWPCVNCLTDPHEDPRPWCDCLEDETCAGPCRRKAHLVTVCHNYTGIAQEWTLWEGRKSGKGQPG